MREVPVKCEHCLTCYRVEFGSDDAGKIKPLKVLELSNVQKKEPESHQISKDCK